MINFRETPEMKKQTILLAAALLALTTSCRYQKDLVYFDGLNEANIKNETSADEKAYRIRVNDILYVRVISQNEEINRLFQAAQGTSQGGGIMYFGEEAQYYMGYSVKDDGIVDIPMLGSVPVEGLTIEEARVRIQAKSTESLNDAVILVRLANFRVTFLGEINGRGTYTFYSNQTTILEAIGKAGDLTDYGNRREVLIIRPTPEGSKTYRVNLQNPDLLASSDYFIQPNDLIYVPPLKVKGTQMFTSDFGLLLGAFTSVVSSVTFILTLIFTLKK